MVDLAKLPPVADILSPGWYQDVTGPVKILGRIQAAHPPFTWKVLAGQGIEPSSWTKVGHGMGHDPLTGTIGRFDPAGLPDGQYTLVLEVTDASGIVGEDRQAFTVQRDPSLLAAFPLTLGASAESSPKFADLGGDGSQELIVADQSGRVHALEAGGKELPGWPVHENAAASPAGPVRAGFVSSPAVADLNGGSRPDVVIGGLDGNVYAWDAAGHPLPGWPVPTKVPPGGDPSNPHWEATVISSPAVGEIDGNVADGPEVVVGAGDGKVYAFHSDGTPVAGFPALLQDPSQAKETAKIASSPAIGDIDGDKQNEIVIGDGETYGNSARVYALRGDGSYEPGWPVTLTGLAPNVTPVVGQGVPESPVLADINGDGALEVAISGVTTRFHLLQGNGTEAPGGASLQFFSASFGPNRDPNLSAPDAVATVANLAFGDMNRDGHPDMASALTDSRLFAAFQRPGQRIPFQHMVAVWTTGPGGAMFKAFPRVVEDWMFITAPVFADVDGDGKPEMVIGNGDGYVHAFKPNGNEATGWPKYVGQWVEAAVAAGDIDNDGKTDIAVVTRQGQVFVFSTDGSASGLDWPSMRGTPANTGVFVEP
ncbi:MAG TPA: VCBS repeat-containing protein, partial [Actinomycetota bacterium]|nr:VCBS repeat-containing protein [Actinomycetota bacterium]